MNKKGFTFISRIERGFTLIEILVVIAILAILAVILLIILNPQEATKRSKDSTRLSDFSNLEQAISTALTVGQQDGMSQAQILCSGVSNPSPANPCIGTTIDIGNYRAINGSGWVKINFTTTNVSFSVLPIDPANSSQNHYSYFSDGNNWEIAARLESQQDAHLMNSQSNLYTIGTRNDLITENIYQTGGVSSQGSGSVLVALLPHLLQEQQSGTAGLLPRQDKSVNNI